MPEARFLELVRRCVDDILWREWDPIGVNDDPWARDEYDDYVASIVALIQTRASADEIARHLQRLETQSMASRRPLEAVEPAARRLAKLVDLLS